MNKDGLTLLETMVALVIFGLVVFGFLEVFAGTSRVTENLASWSQAIAYAEDAMEQMKIDGIDARVTSGEILNGGFERHVETQSWRYGLEMVTVVVSFPDGGVFSVSRLVEIP